MATKRPWMPLYIADFLADTTHLSSAETGAYLFLIMHYWTNGRLPAAEEAIQRVTRMTNRQWAKSRNILKSFFTEDWRHHRIDREIAKVIEKSQVNSANAAKSHVNGRRVAAKSHQVSQHTLQTSNPKPTPFSRSVAYAGTTTNFINQVEEEESSVGQPIPVDWMPNDRDLEMARKQGMADGVIQQQLLAFRAYNVQFGKRSHNWSATWVLWCLNWKERSSTAAGIEASGPFKPTEEQWHSTVERWKANNSLWSHKIYGPEPGQTGCRCPATILTAHGIDPATGLKSRTAASLTEAGSK
ncbi:YdaU family protein [Bradyrhizobium sp. 1050_B9_N1_2]|uniref:YdaU family protein n=1 Tax=Bradyrhizobium sp. 1050_B9_N1_2 TaxID=3238688 RepID=UPI003EDB71BF